MFWWLSRQNVSSIPGCDRGACVLEQDTIFSSPRRKWVPVRAELVVPGRSGKKRNCVWCAEMAAMSCILPRELRWFQEWFMSLMSRGNNTLLALWFCVQSRAYLNARYYYYYYYVAINQTGHYLTFPNNYRTSDNINPREDLFHIGPSFTLSQFYTKWRHMSSHTLHDKYSWRLLFVTSEWFFKNISRSLQNSR